MQNLVGPSVLLDAVDPPEHHHLALPAHGHCMEVHRQWELDPQSATKKSGNPPTENYDYIICLKTNSACACDDCKSEKRHLLH